MWRVIVVVSAIFTDTEIQHQRHRTRLIRKVSRELDVPTMMTPTLNDLLCFYSMCGAEKVSDLINNPVVYLFGTESMEVEKNVWQRLVDQVSSLR
jgi:hypothetical protein